MIRTTQNKVMAPRTLRVRHFFDLFLCKRSWIDHTILCILCIFFTYTIFVFTQTSFFRLRKLILVPRKHFWLIKLNKPKWLTKGWKMASSHSAIGKAVSYIIYWDSFQLLYTLSVAALLRQAFLLRYEYFRWAVIVRLFVLPVYFASFWYPMLWRNSKKLGVSRIFLLQSSLIKRTQSKSFRWFKCICMFEYQI